MAAPNPLLWSHDLLNMVGALPPPQWPPAVMSSGFDCRLKLSPSSHRSSRSRLPRPSFLFPCCLLKGASAEERGWPQNVEEFFNGTLQAWANALSLPVEKLG